MSDITLPPPTLAHLCNLAVEVGVPIDAGHSPLGQRRLVAILGGSVGGRLSGRVLSGGADFQLIHGATLPFNFRSPFFVTRFTKRGASCTAA